MENQKKHIEISVEMEEGQSCVKITGYTNIRDLFSSSYNVMQAIAEVASEQIDVDSRVVLKAMAGAILTQIEDEED